MDKLQKCTQQSSVAQLFVAPNSSATVAFSSVIELPCNTTRVESTTPKWAIGQIPSEYASSSFEVAHWISSPVLVLKKSWFESRSYSVWSEATCKVILQMFNLGPGRSTGIKAHWEILERKRRKWKLLAQGDSYLDDMQEGEERIDTIPFQGVIGDKSRLRVVLSSNASRDQIVEIDLYSKSR